MEFGPFDLDPCGTSDNAKAKEYFDGPPGADGLDRTWKGRVFMNPPYSKWRKWVEKAVREVTRGGATLVVALLPADTSTKIFHSHIWRKAEVRFLKPRVTYWYRGKPGPHPARFSSMVVVWRRISG
jgi:site-specific DNA-methyltransferase (adenine-specific)